MDCSGITASSGGAKLIDERVDGPGRIVFADVVFE